MSTSLKQEIINLNNAVDNFAGQMKDKLKIKARQGYRNWDDIEMRNVIANKLHDHFERFIKGDVSQGVDCANLIMMLTRLEEKI